MAYNFLGLVNEINRRLNEVELTASNFSTAKGFYAHAKDAVNASLRHINQSEYSWPFNHVTQEDTLTAGITRYPFPYDCKVISFDSFRIKEDSSLNTNTKKLKVLDYEEYLEKAVKNGDDTTARNKVHIAATVAGMGFGNAQAGIAHSIGHSAGACFHKPHGSCVGLALPYILQYGANNDPGVKELLAEIAQRSLDIWEKDVDKAYRALLDSIKKLYQNIGAPLTLQDLGISEQEFKDNLDKFVAFSNSDPCTVSNRPVPEEEDFRKIISCMWDGKTIDF